MRLRVFKCHNKCPLAFPAVVYAEGSKGSGGGSSGGSTCGSGEAGADHWAFVKGTPVFDDSHKANRGYGVVESPRPELDDDGDWRCKVRFTGGERATWLKCKYLEVPAVSPILRQDPTAVQQRVRVAVGPHKGKDGTTMKKVGG